MALLGIYAIVERRYAPKGDLRTSGVPLAARHGHLACGFPTYLILSLHHIGVMVQSHRDTAIDPS
jgi:hypothetical protein